MVKKMVFKGSANYLVWARVWVHKDFLNMNSSAGTVINNLVFFNWMHHKASIQAAIVVHSRDDQKTQNAFKSCHGIDVVLLLKNRAPFNYNYAYHASKESTISICTQNRSIFSTVL